MKNIDNLAIAYAACARWTCISRFLQSRLGCTIIDPTRVYGMDGTRLTVYPIRVPTYRNHTIYHENCQCQITRMFNTKESQQSTTELPREYQTFEVDSITPHIGAVVRDVDLSQRLTDVQLQDVFNAWYDWKVLVFRNQNLTREQHKSFARHFGDLHVHPMQHTMRGDPEILKVKTTGESPYTAGDGWHTDVTCDEVPPLGSMLYVTETPASGGGATLFADMYLAYDLLSEPFQRFLETLTAVHDGSLPYVGSYKSREPEGGYPKNSHPLVIHHPATKRKVLYVNAGFTSHIRGLKRAESTSVLQLLYEHIESTPRLWCQVQWEPHTLTFWDNRCTQHHAVWDYFPHSRYGERVSIIGTERPSFKKLQVA